MNGKKLFYQDIINDIVDSSGKQIYFFTEQMPIPYNMTYKYKDVPTISFCFTSRKIEPDDKFLYHYKFGYTIKKFSDTFSRKKAFNISYNRLKNKPLDFFVNFDDVFPHNISYDSKEEIVGVVTPYIQMKLCAGLIHHISAKKVFTLIEKNNRPLRENMLFLETLHYEKNKTYIQKAGYYLL